MTSQAYLTSASFLMGMSASISASCLLGVISSQMGMSSLLIALARSFVASESPTVATMTGSTIRGTSWSSRKSATTSTISGLYSMPVLIAFMSTSFITASSCACTISSDTGSMPSTAVVF